MKDIAQCEAYKEIWDFLDDLYKESEQITRNKLQVYIKKYDAFTVILGESVKEMEFQFKSIISDLTT